MLPIRRCGGRFRLQAGNSMKPRCGSWLSNCGSRSGRVRALRRGVSRRSGRNDTAGCRRIRGHARRWTSEDPVSGRSNARDSGPSGDAAAWRAKRDKSGAALGRLLQPFGVATWQELVDRAAERETLAIELATAKAEYRGGDRNG